MELELVEKFGLEKVDESKYRVRKLPDGRIAFVVFLGDSRKATSKLWARKVKNVDTTKENGFAFEGEFFKPRGKYHETEIILAPYEVAIAVIQDGSWKHPGQRMSIFVALDDGIYKVSSGWETKADKIQTIHLVAEILNFLNSK
jgi:hypothetical protein